MHQGLAGLEARESVWRSLAESRKAGAFLGYGFAVAAARHHEARGDRVLIATVEWGGRIACILPVAVGRRGGVNVAVALGDPVVQYADALMGAGAPKVLASVALQRLADRVDIDVLSFRRVRADAAIRPALQSRGRPAGEASQASYADLTIGATEEDTMATLGGSKQKRERQRSRRRLAERGEVLFDVRRGPAASAWLREAFALKQARLSQAGHASPVIDDPDTVRLFEAAAEDPFDGGDVVATKLTVGGDAAAYEVGLVRGRRYHAYLGVVAERFAAQGPGKVVMDETVRWCFRQGLEVFDMLPPFDDYKRFWTTGAVEVRDYVEPASIAGSLYAGPWLGAVKPRLRSALRGLPPQLRRRLGAAALKTGIA